MAWTVEGEILNSLDRKDQYAFAVVLSTTLLTTIVDKLRLVRKQEVGIITVHLDSNLSFKLKHLKVHLSKPQV